MSVCLPFSSDLVARAKLRGPYNILGSLIFVVLYIVLPKSMYPYIGIIGGIGVGDSAGCAWQTVFNTFGALAIAEKLYGLKGAVGLRVAQNVFGVVFALLFCAAFYWVMERVTGRRIAGEQNI